MYLWLLWWLIGFSYKRSWTGTERTLNLSYVLMCDKASENGPEWKSVTVATVVMNTARKNTDTYNHISGYWDIFYKDLPKKPPTSAFHSKGLQPVFRKKVFIYVYISLIKIWQMTKPSWTVQRFFRCLQFLFLMYYFDVLCYIMHWMKAYI